MPTREFTDSHDVTWRVWSTVPGEDSPLAKYYPGGWLTFDCGGDTLRRLSPPPSGWEALGPERLELMCRVAAEVPRHTGEIARMPRPLEGPLATPPASSEEVTPADTDSDEHRNQGA